MRILKSVTIFLLTFLGFSINNLLFAQLRGNFVYEELPGFERSASINPCVRIKSIYPDLKFNWSGGEPKIIEKNGDWILTLKPGLQTLYVSAENYESLDIKVDLRKYEVKTFRITPVIKQFYLKVETKPDGALVILKEGNGNKIVKGLSPFEYYPYAGEYNLYISGIEYKSIDTTIVFKTRPITKLKFTLDEIQKETNPSENIKLKSTSPIKVDSTVAVTDSISVKDARSKVVRLLKIAGTATVGVWLVSEIIFNQNQKKKEHTPLLPGVPDFPGP